MQDDPLAKIAFWNPEASPIAHVEMGGFTQSQARGVRDRVLGRYSIAYVLEGRGQYEDATGIRCDVNCGDVIVVTPEVRHSYGPAPSTSWREVFVTFNGPVFDHLARLGRLGPPRPVRRLRPIAKWSARLSEFITGPRPQTPIERDMEALRFLSLACELIAATEEATESWITRARGMLEGNLAKECDLRAIAETLDVSYETLRRRFREHTGMTPGQYRTRHRIETARRLIAQTDLTNAQLAESLGFADEYYFSKRFKEVTGKTPSQYRTQATGRRRSRSA